MRAKGRGQRRKSTKSEVFCAASMSWGQPYIALAAAGAGLRAAAFVGGFPQKLVFGRECGGAEAASTTPSRFASPVSPVLFFIWLGWVGVRRLRGATTDGDGRVCVRCVGACAIWKARPGRVGVAAASPSARACPPACLFCPRPDWMGGSGRVWCLNFERRRLLLDIFSFSFYFFFPSRPARPSEKPSVWLDGLVVPLFAQTGSLFS